MWWIVACREPEATKDVVDPRHTAAVEHTGDPGVPHSGAAHTAHTADPEHTATPPTGGLYPQVPFDCAGGVPPGPYTSRPLAGVRTTEDIAFDTVGNLVGSAFAGPLTSFTHAGVSTVVAVFGETRGIDLLPDGRVVASNPDDGSVVEVDTATGSVVQRAVVAVGLSGIDVDADGVVYAGDLSFTDGRMYAIAPDGTTTRFASVGHGAQSYGAILSPDEDRLYLTRYNLGEIWVSDRDPVSREFGEASPWASTASRGYSGGATDVCGNVYVMDAFRCEVWRFDPTTADGEVVFRGPPRWYCANLAFGRDLGGFGGLQLYVSTYEEVLEVDIGVPGRPR